MDVTSMIVPIMRTAATSGGLNLLGKRLPTSFTRGLLRVNISPRSEEPESMIFKVTLGNSPTGVTLHYFLPSKLALRVID